MDELFSLFQEAFGFLDEPWISIACILTSACGLLLLRSYIQGAVCRSTVRMDAKTVLITGANAGIGKATAKDLAKRGARVLMACRSKTKADAAADEIRQYSGSDNVAVYILDLASLASVRECAIKVIAKETRLDVLINNAGVFWSPNAKTVDGFETHFGTNHLGHFLFTNLLLDLIKKSSPSRIINVSSWSHASATINQDADITCQNNIKTLEAYGRSKLANVLFTRELSKRLEGSNVTVNSLHPGLVDTEIFWEFAGMMCLPLRILIILGHYLIGKHLAKTSKQGAQTSIYLAVAPELEHVTGKYFCECAVTSESKTAQDDELARRLWHMSNEMLGIKWK